VPIPGDHVGQASAQGRLHGHLQALAHLDQLAHHPHGARLLPGQDGANGRGQAGAILQDGLQLHDPGGHGTAPLLGLGALGAGLLQGLGGRLAGFQDGLLLSGGLGGLGSGGLEGVQLDLGPGGLLAQGPGLVQGLLAAGGFLLGAGLESLQAGVELGAFALQGGQAGADLRTRSSPRLGTGSEFLAQLGQAGPGLRE